MIQKDVFDAMSEGNTLWYETYKNETVALKNTLQTMQPKTILDVGS
jgi:hypothetical protein